MPAITNPAGSRKAVVTVNPAPTRPTTPTVVINPAPTRPTGPTIAINPMPSRPEPMIAINPMPSRPPVIINPMPVAPKHSGLTAVADGVAKAYYHGPKQIQSRVKELENLLQTARMTPEAYGKVTAEVAALKVATKGSDAIEKRLGQIDDIMRRGFLNPESFTALERERFVLNRVNGDFKQLDAKVKKLEDKSGRAERISQSVLATAHLGYDNVSKTIAKMEDMLTRARFTKEGLEDGKLTIKVLKHLQSGGAEKLKSEHARLGHLLTVAFMDPARYEATVRELAVLKTVADAYGVFLNR